ncbi:DUF3786 domain-containing protein [Chloroflexota bacterium]
MLAGEQPAWEILSELDPKDVCIRTKITFDDPTGAYILKSFLQDIVIAPKNKQIYGNSSISNFLLKEVGNYFRLSVLWYLISAKDISLSGTLIKPADMPGGQIYSKGSHALPLDKIVEKYGTDLQGFLKKGMELGGERLNFGDVSLRFYPLPRIPVSILLWENNEEFPARCDLLLDSTCKLQLPVDIIWSTAMMSTLIIL